MLLWSALIGALAGLGLSVIEQANIAVGGRLAEPLDMRARKPRDGDNWSSCAAARAAGTAPIVRGEAGYRAGLDADGDGVACEVVAGARLRRIWGF